MLEKFQKRLFWFIAIQFFCLGIWTTSAFAQDPLPSWNEGQTKQQILDFVRNVTTASSSNFVPPEERIAVFDNDGTLLSEQPAYFQLLFAIDRIKELARQHPEWKTRMPFKAVLENDMAALADSGEKGLIQLVMASHAGMTTAEFEKIVKDWLATSQHPRFKRPFTDLVYRSAIAHFDAQPGHKAKQPSKKGKVHRHC